MPGIIIPNFEFRDLFMEFGAQEAKKCYQCGMCMSLCPWFQLEGVEFAVYRLAQAVRLGGLLNAELPEEVAAEVNELYRCVGCESCLAQCPRGVDIPAFLRAVRRIMVENRSVPAALQTTISQALSTGNPWAGAREARTEWAKGLEVPEFAPDMEFLWFTCCTADYDPRCQKINRATARLLAAAGVSFGILPNHDCCGEAFRRAGAEELFSRLAATNTSLLRGSAGQRLLVTSPHCLNSFHRDYQVPGLQPLHVTQLLSRLIAEGRLRPGQEFPRRVVYHDPCTLGRQQGIYDEPRQVLKSIPGLELLEIENFSRDQSVCCGGGGGGLWLDWPKGERLSDLRVRQAAETGAGILAVACPYCLLMFEDSVKTLGLELQVMDITEILAASIPEAESEVPGS
ncbi:MAG: (Fe-S)-binding protein [candidate division WOR-3 bacterium]